MREFKQKLKSHQRNLGYRWEYVGETVQVEKGDKIGLANQIVSLDGKSVFNYCDEKVFTYKSDKMVNHLHVKAEYNNPSTKGKQFINLGKYYSGGIQSEVLKEDKTGRIS